MTFVVGGGLRKEREGQAGSRNEAGDDEDDESLLFDVGHVVSPIKFQLNSRHICATTKHTVNPITSGNTVASIVHRALRVSMKIV